MHITILSHVQRPAHSCAPPTPHLHQFEGALLPLLLALFHGHRALCAACPRALLHALVRTHVASHPTLHHGSAGGGGGGGGGGGVSDFTPSLLARPGEGATGEQLQRMAAAAAATALRTRLLLELMAPAGMPLRATQVLLPPPHPCFPLTRALPPPSS